MLKMMAKGTKDGKPVTIICLGLSHENLRRLKADEPIIFTGSVFEMPDVEFLIFSEIDEESMAAKFNDLIGPNTKITRSDGP